MDKSQLRKKIASRGHWLLIVIPIGGVNDDIHPREKYKILQKQAIKYRGWPYPYFPDIDNREDFADLTIDPEKITGDIDFEHYKESFTLFKSNQFVHIRGISEDWVDESPTLQESSLKNYSSGEVLSFVSTTYFFTEVFLFVFDLINSDLYKDTENFHFRFHCQKTAKRKLKILDLNRVGFFMDYKSTARNIEIHNQILNTGYFNENWEKLLIESCIKFYRFFGSYEPIEEVIKNDINNLINRKY